MLCAFDFYLKLSQVLGFIPLLNINTFELFDEIPYKIYPAAITIILFVPLYTKISSRKDVIDVSLLSLVFTTGVSSYRTAYINRTEWKNLCQLYKVINKKITSKCLDSLDLGVKHFIATAIYILHLLSIRLVVYYDKVEEFSLLMDLLWFIKLTKDCLAIYFLSILTKGFKMVNKHSKYVLKEAVISNIRDSIFNGTPTFCRNLYSNLYEMSVHINNIFGWMMATSWLDCFVRMCLTIQKIINVTTKREPVFSKVFLVILLVTYSTVSYFVSNVSNLSILLRSFLTQLEFSKKLLLLTCVEHDIFQNKALCNFQILENNNICKIIN